MSGFQCRLCQASLKTGRVGDANGLRASSCGHVFHANCLRGHFARQEEDQSFTLAPQNPDEILEEHEPQISYTCPVCGEQIMPETCIRLILTPVAIQEQESNGVDLQQLNEQLRLQNESLKQDLAEAVKLNRAFLEERAVLTELMVMNERRSGGGGGRTQRPRVAVIDTPTRKIESVLTAVAEGSGGVEVHVGSRVVWLREDGAHPGTVKWLGKITERGERSGLEMAAVEFDNLAWRRRTDPLNPAGPLSLCAPGKGRLLALSGLILFKHYFGSTTSNYPNQTLRT